MKRVTQTELRKSALASASLFALSVSESGSTEKEIIDALLWAAKAVRRHRAPRSIYILRDPRSEAIRYVGCAIDVRKRLKSHITQSSTGESAAAEWVRDLKAIGRRPILQVVETVESGHWESAEQKWILHFKALGEQLLNATEGGAGAPGWSANRKTRDRMSAAHIGRAVSAETRARLSEALKGKRKTAEHCAKMSAQRRGKVPPGLAEAAAIVVRGKPKSAEHRAKIAAGNRGKANTSQRKLSDSNAQFIRANRGFMSQRELAKRFGVGVATIHSIQSGRRYALPGPDQGSLFK